MESLENIFLEQAEQQTIIISKVREENILFPMDCPTKFATNALMLIEEIGEILQNDKRWRDIRNNSYNEEEKRKELSDAFICLVNMCLYSDISYQDMIETITQTQANNRDRLKSAD